MSVCWIYNLLYSLEIAEAVFRETEEAEFVKTQVGRLGHFIAISRVIESYPSLCQHRNITETAFNRSSFWLKFLAVDDYHCGL